MMARYYGANLGRFLSVDPGFDVQPERPQSWNLYGYVRNNPGNAFDPTGRDSWLLTWAPNVDAVGHSGWATQQRDAKGDPNGMVEVRHLWPATGVNKSGQAPADYRFEVIKEADLAKFTGGEGHGADGIVRIVGDAAQDAKATTVLDAGKKNQTYDARVNSCSTYTKSGVAAVGLPGGNGGTVTIDLPGPINKTLNNVTTPVSVHRAVAGSGDSRVKVEKQLPAAKDTNDLTVTP